MADVTPFRAVRYRDLEALRSVVAPPYDVISSADQQALYEASPHNIVRLELPQREEGDRANPRAVYERTAALLKHWLAEKVLVQDPVPAFYGYRQTYQLPGQLPRGRIAFFGAVKLEEFSSGVILPHEETFAGPKADRMQVLSTCRANLSPIFGIYPDAPAATTLLRKIVESSPMADFTDTLQIRHEIWRVDSPQDCDTISAALADRTILIADGHHRYETALAYRNERRQRGSEPQDHWSERALFALVSMKDDGLVVLPTHRVLRGLDPAVLVGWKSRLVGVAVTAMPSEQALQALAAPAADAECRMALVLSGQSYLLQFATASGAPVDRLDVTRLHRQVLPALAGTADPHALDIQYTQDASLAVRLVQEGAAPAAILLNATPVERVDEVAASGARMPEKSTYFYPKLSTGLVLRVDTGEPQS